MANWGSLPPISIDDNSALPKYSQLATAIAKSILEGKMAINSRLPSENELFELLQVSRSTIRKALSELENRGLVIKKQGQGSFVSSQAMDLAKTIFGKQALLPAVQALSGGTIGLLIPNMSNEIYPLIIRGVEEVAAQRGCTVFIGNTYSDRNRELMLMEQMISLKVRGLIIEPTQARHDTPDTRNFQLLANYPYPCVVIDNDIPGINWSRVKLDDVAGGRLATEYLLSFGHRRIAYIYKESVIAAIDRREGYLTALAAAGIPIQPDLLIAYTEAQEADFPGYTLTKALLALPDRPEAIFYYNDDLAFGGMQAIRDAGLAIPRDISVIGSDNAASSASQEFQLSSIEHPKQFIGRWAADILFDQIQAGKQWIRRCITIHPELVQRLSVGPAPLRKIQGPPKESI